MKTKVFGTTTVSGIIGHVARAHGYKKEHNQFRVIAKARGIGTANAAVHNAGFPYDVFDRTYTTESGNAQEISLCEREDVWVEITGLEPGGEYLPMRQIMEEYIGVKE